MTTTAPALTVFTGTLVQDSPLSISGIDRASPSDRPFTIVDGEPVLSGKALKGAAVAMARRFFDPLPRSISEDANRTDALRESSWRFRVEHLVDGGAPTLRHRAGAGIRHKTGARAQGVQYDRETTEAGTRWTFQVLADGYVARDEATEAEGILGYVLAEHWASGRCWLGGDVARGMGWCHLENLRAYRLTASDWDRWETSKTLPDAMESVPTVEPTRSWSFRAFDVRIAFGEYQPDQPHDEKSWGLDTLSVGPHELYVGSQETGSGYWATPPWMDGAAPPVLATDRAIVTDGKNPVIPGSSLRGAMRHDYSRRARARGDVVIDPHTVEGNVPDTDCAGKLFGTVTQSSPVLIRDAVLAPDTSWTAARFHMHAEDEFSAGSYGSSKRDAVRLLSGEFVTEIVVEAAAPDAADHLAAQVREVLDRGHLVQFPVGGHKTRGAGWGHWSYRESTIDIVKQRDWAQPRRALRQPAAARQASLPEWSAWKTESQTVWLLRESGRIDIESLTLGAALGAADVNGLGKFMAWWCEPTIDFTVTQAPETLGTEPPDDNPLLVDEAAFFFEAGCLRVARTANGVRWARLREHPAEHEHGVRAEVRHVPAQLHGGGARFDVQRSPRKVLVVREWIADGVTVGFTLATDGKAAEHNA